MTFLFTPDIFNYDEEFTIETDTLDEAIAKVQKEWEYNVLFAVYRVFNANHLEYIGLLQLAENKDPEWLKEDCISIGGID